MKKPWKIDVPVLLIFFARPETLEKVFESIREARPKTLLLWQDGPRKDRPGDIEKIEACRKIVENIDWDCEVHKYYHEKNMGCDPSTFRSHKWAFTIVDKCIIMEDDRVPEQSFYQYCKELLDYYENDTRISHICGTNLLGVYENCDSDYFFSSKGSTTWATWRRVAQQWEENYDYLQDEYAIECLKHNNTKSDFNMMYNTAVRHKNTGKEYWETILGMSCVLNNQVAIIPKRNMIKDIGLTSDSTHAVAEAKCIHPKQRSMFDMQTYPMEFPIKHPKYIQIDRVYNDEIDKFSGKNHPLLKLKYTLYRLVMYARYGQFKRFATGLIYRIKGVTK